MVPTFFTSRHLCLVNLLSGSARYYGLQVPLLGQASLPISITELCRKLCHRQPVTLLEAIETGAITLPFNFSVIKFLHILPKTLKFGRHTLQLSQMISNKII